VPRLKCPGSRAALSPRLSENFPYIPQGRPCGRPPAAAVLGRRTPDGERTRIVGPSDCAQQASATLDSGWGRRLHLLQHLAAGHRLAILGMGDHDPPELMGATLLESARQPR
jgi:hypothetical protein